jgi:mono/diheme cytochrome c family protein
MKKLLGLIALIVIVVAGVLLYRSGNASSDNVADASIKAADAPPPDAAAVKRGAYVAVAADCAACHTAPGSSDAFAGGYPLKTPFGIIESTNITPERSTGLGNWTERDFFRAVRHGKSPHGLLYPAMPYNAYVKLSDQDMHDLWAYVRSLKPVDHANAANQLPFPYNVRSMMLGWNLLFFDNTPFKAQPSQSADWNRGAYLVDGAGHCASCHTPKNGLGGDKRSAYLQGYNLQGWFAPEIAGNPHVGLGDWSTQDITQYLKLGSNGKAVASGPMAEAVENSTQHLSDADLAAIATYLKTVPGSTGTAPPALAASDARMTRGAHLYEINCSACHNVQGQGIDGMVTAFAGNPAIQSHGQGSLIQTVLKGGRAAITDGNPTGAGMPSFAWKLSDADIADVLTYVRNSWGNAAAPVDASEVQTARKELDARAPLVAH